MKSKTKNIRSTTKEPQKDSVEVYCRIKSLSDPSDSSCISLYSSTEIGFTPEALKNRKLLQYTFSYVFTENTDQKTIFERIALPLLNGLVKGENGLLFSYGVTGSGKTYTMSGERNNPGIVPRCINTLFNSIGNHQTLKYIIKSDKLNGFEVQAENEALLERLREAKIKYKINRKQEQIGDAPESFSNEEHVIKDIDDSLLYTVFVTYIEIYNNIAYDLLDTVNPLQAKILREDCRRVVYLNNIAEIEVKSAQQALDQYLLGNQRKHMRCTSLNTDSSRSHSIFNIRLVISPQFSEENTTKDSLIISQFSLVDLAGSERCNRANTKGVSLKEAGCINSSLMALRNCLNILRDNQQTGQHKKIPYRDTRLTHMFKNYFEGEGRVKMIVCLNPSIKDFEETIQVLQFAEMSQEVKISRPPLKSIENIENPTIITKEMINPQNTNIKTMILYLKRRQNSHETMDAIRDMTNKFRMRLKTVQDAQDNYDNVVKLLPTERAKVKDLKHKLLQKNVLLDTAAEQCLEKDEEIKKLQEKISMKDSQLRQNLTEKQKQQQKLAQLSEQMTHELDRKLRRQQKHYDVVMKTQSNKMELVKDILDNKDRSSSGHIARRSTPVVNTRYRRSRSTGDIWLQHKPVQPVPLDTVLQPKIRTRKSVDKLTAKKDIVNSKQSRYLLITQEADDGGIETKLFKGDIIPTCTGGAQVIFDDVEKLRQEPL